MTSAAERNRDLIFKMQQQHKIEPLFLRAPIKGFINALSADLNAIAATLEAAE